MKRHAIVTRSCFSDAKACMTTWKIKILKKWTKNVYQKKFNTSVPKIMIICYTASYASWDSACDRCNIYFSFWVMFWSFTPTQKIKILQKWKNDLEISSFYTCALKIMITWCTVPEIWCVPDRWTDGQLNRQKNWHIEVGVPPKNNKSICFFEVLL